jgi:hypothetical protein
LDGWGKRKRESEELEYLFIFEVMGCPMQWGLSPWQPGSNNPLVSTQDPASQFFKVVYLPVHLVVTGSYEDDM